MYNKLKFMESGGYGTFFVLNLRQSGDFQPILRRHTGFERKSVFAERVKAILQHSAEFFQIAKKVNIIYSPSLLTKLSINDIINE